MQRNKTKHLAENFTWVHGVDRLIIAERLSNQRSDSQAALNICLQVNIDGQDTKDGCQPEEVTDLVAQISQLPNLRLRGLMVIPAPEILRLSQMPKPCSSRSKAIMQNLKTGIL